MEDREVIEAFVAGGARHAFGPKLHIEGDCLSFDGWWEAAFRISSDTFAVRDETPPEQSGVIDEVAAQLRSRGARVVGADPTLLVAITYTSIDLGAADWTLWSRDAATAEAALRTRASGESFLSDASPMGSSSMSYAAEMGGARRSAGLPALVVLTVGVDPAAAAIMAAALSDCRIESRTLDEVSPDAYGTLLANLVLVDATSQLGKDFLAGVGGDGHGVPLVAISDEGSLVGADATVDPASPPAEWAGHIRSLLP
ncbi:MAG: hypothetical protein ACR2G7_06870 [Acidimicrobiales bacterium]